MRVWARFWPVAAFAPERKGLRPLSTLLEGVKGGLNAENTTQSVVSSKSSRMEPAAFSLDPSGVAPLLSLDGLSAVQSKISSTKRPMSEASPTKSTTISPSTNLDTTKQDRSRPTLPDKLWVPSDFKHPLKLPKALSPSSILEFQKCPQSFFFQYILGLRQPTNAILVKGTMCHAALEDIFDLDVPDRTLDNLQNLFRKHWAQSRTQENHLDLFDSRDDEIQWGHESLQLLANYYSLEDPRHISAPNPVQKESWVVARLHPDLLVRGIIDRLDLVRTPEGGVVLRLTDYKSGKAPHLKYANWMNERIKAEAFDQLVMYGLLLRESKSNPMPLRFLRLLHLTNHAGSAETLKLDLGATPEERDERLDAMKSRILEAWGQMQALLEQPDPFLAFTGCSRSFCYCHKCRKRFRPGTVWDPSMGESS